MKQSTHSKYSGAVQTLGGRRWYWNWRARSYDAIPEDMEDYQIEDWLAGFERNFSLNMPIQGTCAEVMLVALAYVDQAVREMDARIIATVHDEIVLLAAEDDVADVMNSVRRCMTRAWTDFHPDSETRGLVEIKAGATWRDAH